MRTRYVFGVGAALLLGAGCASKPAMERQAKAFDMSPRQTKAYIRTVMEKQGWETDDFTGETTTFFRSTDRSKSEPIRIRVAPAAGHPDASAVEATGPEAPMTRLFFEMERRLPPLASP